MLAPIGRNSASPWPTSFSAPGWSRMTRLSVRLEVANASRDGTLALISPVTTSTLGRWVASTRWMPGRPGELGDPDDRVLHVARRDHHQVGELVDDHQQVRVRHVDSRSLPGGARDLPGPHRLVEVVDVPEPGRGQVVIARSISPTTHCSASAAFFGLVMIWVIRCGIPAYAVSSTRFGSTRIMRTSSGVARIRIEVISPLMQVELWVGMQDRLARYRRLGLLTSMHLTGTDPTGLDVSDVTPPGLAVRPDIPLPFQLAAEPEDRLMRPEADAVGHRGVVLRPLHRLGRGGLPCSPGPARDPACLARAARWWP